MPTDAADRVGRCAHEAYVAFEDTIDIGGARVLLAAEAPDTPMVNRIVGLGLDGPATESQLDRALAAVPDGTRFYVAVDPQAQPPELPDWLRARGLDQGWGWMMFTRAASIAPPAVTSELVVTPVRPGEADAFARIVRLGYDLPEAVETRLARAPETGWQMFTADEAGTPIGAAGIFVREGVGYLGFAATLPEGRGRGAQNALLAARIEHARARGCDLLCTETGERRDELPSNSYRNILRAGFEERYVVANWVGTAGALTPPSR